MGHIVTANGDVQHTPFGSNTAIRFTDDATKDYLSLADSSDWNFGAGEFTIDLWVNFASTPGDYDGIFSTHNIPGPNPGYRMDVHDGTIQLYAGSLPGYWLNTGVTPVVGQWYHLALVRSVDTLTIYVNGEPKVSKACTGVNFNSAGAGLVFGRVFAGTAGYNFDGYMDEIRVLKGTARWTADFSAALPNDPS